MVQGDPALEARPRSPAARRASVAAVFDRVAAEYDQLSVAWFSPMARELVRLLEPMPGERAIDIGCGRGAVMFELAAALGAGGRVQGIDLSQKMIEHARRDPRNGQAGSAPIELQVMDAATPTLPEACLDLATASFVLFFLPAPVPALRAWRRLLAPGGRLGVTTFAAHRGGWLSAALAPYLPPGRADGAQLPSPFDSDAGVEGLLSTAGFGRIRTVTIELALEFNGVAQWYAWSLSHGQRAVWERIAEADRPRAVASAADELQRWRRCDGTIALTERVRCTIGHRPMTT
ncbi:class I SAM-dependent methyltransferase [Jatrophihabitans sp.]|uniref:class I SAM-dependent methyltransferase n=1 Tax=Jatrophihabitans sp. TaxID=1932789 RepID=UPI002F167BC9